jgi:TolB protein
MKRTHYPRACFKNILMVAVVAGMAVTSRAQLVVTTSAPGTAPPIWVSMSGFSGEAAEVLQFDLYVQGFGFTNAQAAQYLISGSANGNLQGQVTDNISKRPVLSKGYTGASIRRLAHLFADEFVNTIGGKGIASTRIAFKVQNGPNSEIYVADFDGHNAQQVTSDNTIVAAPCWVPNRLALCYTSYKLGNPDIFYHDLRTGERHALARYSGLNTSASVSADGSRVAMILSKGGSPDVYVSDLSGGNLLRLTATREDESSPCWSPDGQWVCYAGRPNDRRMLLKIPAGGGTAQHVRTDEVSNPTEPDWSPDNKWIAFTRQAGGFDICVVPAGGGRTTVLVGGEKPSWSGNSRTLIFVRNAGGRHMLSLLDVPTKQVKDISRVPGNSNSSQPSWAR